MENQNNDIELKLVGITYNQIESGVYALVLEDIKMKRRLAIVIGYPEAQSIECRLQNVKTPRPLSHDLMASLLNNLGGLLVRVDITRLPTGPFAGILSVYTKDGEIKKIDARSSDAIALALRVGAPIFTNKELLEKEGYVPQIKQKEKKQTTDIKSQKSKIQTSYNNEQLETLLAKYVSEENYEAAAEIKKELDRRNGKIEKEDEII